MTIMSHVHAAMDLFGTIDIDPTPTAPPGVSELFNMGLGWVMWIAGALGLLGFFILGIRLMLSDNRESTMDHAKGFGRVCGGLILIASASGIARMFL
jgi:hypothetical protein